MGELDKRVRFKIPLDIEWDVPEWIPCPVEGYQHIVCCLRHADDEQVGTLRKLTNTVEFEGRKRVEKLDDDAYVAELFKWGLVDWKSTDGDAMPPCSDDNKIMFMRRHRKPATWAMEMIADGTEIAKIKMERLEAEKKISETGSGQDSTTQS